MPGPVPSQVLSLFHMITGEQLKLIIDTPGGCSFMVSCVGEDLFWKEVFSLDLLESGLPSFRQLWDDNIKKCIKKDTILGVGEPGD